MHIRCAHVFVTDTEKRSLKETSRVLPQQSRSSISKHKGPVLTEGCHVQRLRTRSPRRLGTVLSVFSFHGKRERRLQDKRQKRLQESGVTLPPGSWWNSRLISPCARRLRRALQSNATRKGDNRANTLNEVGSPLVRFGRHVAEHGKSCKSGKRSLPKPDLRNAHCRGGHFF